MFVLSLWNRSYCNWTSQILFGFWWVSDSGGQQLHGASDDRGASILSHLSYISIINCHSFFVSLFTVFTWSQMLIQQRPFHTTQGYLIRTVPARNGKKKSWCLHNIVIVLNKQQLSWYTEPVSSVHQVWSQNHRSGESPQWLVYYMKSERTEEINFFHNFFSQLSQ